MYQPITLSGFEAREAALKNIKRYVDEHTPTMFYRTTDWMHSWRVLAHLENIIPLATKVFPGFNIEFTRRIAITHDDLEMITGDIQLYRKEQMNEKEQKELQEREAAAIGQLRASSPFGIDGYPYRELLQVAKEKKIIEAQVVSYCDKFDGFGEALHEVFAGNHCFLRPAGGTQNGGYIRRLHDFETKYPSLQALLQQEHPMFHPPRIDFEPIVAEGKPHTAVSIVTPTGYAPYDCWKANVMRVEGITALTEQQEFKERGQKSIP